MRFRSQPHLLGLAVSLFGILIWILEWRFSLHLLNPLVLIAKLCAIFGLPFLLTRLSTFTFRQGFRSIGYFVTFVLAALCALVAALPFRQWMPQWANGGERRWYFEGMNYQENDYQAWLERWHRHDQLIFEAAVLICFFLILLIPCFMFRLRPRIAWIPCVVGGLLLAIAPVSRDLLVFDYDTFHLGVALDSVALSLWPLGLGYSNAHSVYEPAGILRTQKSKTT